MMRAFKLCLTLLAFLAMFGSSFAQAQSIDEWRAKGVLGERYDGYVVVRKNDEGAASVAIEVNAQRRKIYEQRAKQQKVTPAEVGQVYAAEILRNAPKGTWFQAADGAWRQK
jgi:uncharacterized protein YdbL (DUF1318 family)